MTTAERRVKEKEAVSRGILISFGLSEEKIISVLPEVEIEGLQRYLVFHALGLLQENIDTPKSILCREVNRVLDTHPLVKKYKWCNRWHFYR